VKKILSKLIDECWRYSERKQCHFWAWLKRPILGVHDSQGSAETLVGRGGITNYYLIAYSFSNISAKNYRNCLMCIEVIAWNVIVVFFETQCTLRMYVAINDHSIVLVYILLKRVCLTVLQCRMLLKVVVMFSCLCSSVVTRRRLNCETWSRRPITLSSTWIQCSSICISFTVLTARVQCEC